MKKTDSDRSPRPTKLFYVLCGLFILLMVLFIVYLGRGWIRTTVVPTFYGFQHKPQIQSAFDQANNQLQPSKALGLKTDRASRAYCNLDTASGLSETVNCVAYSISERSIRQTSDFYTFNQQALVFHERALAAGWVGGDRQNDLKTPTVDKLNSGDYLLIYYKKINDIPCSFQLFSNPGSQGGGNLTGNLSCTKEHTL